MAKYLDENGVKALLQVTDEKIKNAVDAVDVTADVEAMNTSMQQMQNKIDTHTHDNYSLTNHTHDNYALAEHTHDNYALAEHTHDNSISDIEGLQDALDIRRTTWNNTKSYKLALGGDTDTTWKKIISFSDSTIPTANMYHGCTVKGIIYYSLGNCSQAQTIEYPFEVTSYLIGDNEIKDQVSLYLPPTLNRDIIRLVRVGSNSYELQMRQSTAYHYVNIEFTYQCSDGVVVTIGKAESATNASVIRDINTNRLTLDECNYALANHTHTGLSVESILLTNENLNNIKDAGSYYAVGGNSVTNRPNGVDHFGLNIVKTGEKWIKQICFDSTNQFTHVRWYNGADDIWTSWEKENVLQGQHDRIDITNTTLDLNDLQLTADNPHKLPHKMEYINTTTNGANTISNLPFEPQAFVLTVEAIRRVNSTDYITKQSVIGSNRESREATYTRFCVSGTWSEWAGSALQVQLTNHNLNNIMDSGFYYASGNNSITNKPSNVDAFGLTVVKSAGGYYKQTLYSANNTKTLRQTFTRWFDGVWSDWENEDNKYALADHTHDMLDLGGADFKNELLGELDGKYSPIDHAHSAIALTNEDLDNIKDSGFYYAVNGNAILNKPLGIEAFGLQVIQSGELWRTQILYASAFNEDRYIRWYDGTNQVWTEWAKENTIDSIDRLRDTLDGCIHTAGGTEGESGYVAFAQIKVNNSYADKSIEFSITSRRRKTPCVCSVKFTNAEHNDPDIEQIFYMGSDSGVFMQKIDTSTWKLWYQKSEAFDAVSVNYFYTHSKFTITYINDFSKEKPTENVVDAILGYNVKLAKTLDGLTATVDELNYVKGAKGNIQNQLNAISPTWNDSKLYKYTFGGQQDLTWKKVFACSNSNLSPTESTYNACVVVGKVTHILGNYSQAEVREYPFQACFNFIQAGVITDSAKLFLPPTFKTDMLRIVRVDVNSFEIQVRQSGHWQKVAIEFSYSMSAGNAIVYDLEEAVNDSMICDRNTGRYTLEAYNYALANHIHDNMATTPTELITEDLNDIMEAGFYYAPVDNSIINKPDNVFCFGLQVVKLSSLWRKQILHTPRDKFSYIRYYDANNQVWQEWFSEGTVLDHSHTGMETQLIDSNLDNVKQSGFYYGGGGNTVINKPTSVDAFGLIVIRSANNWYKQTLYSSNVNQGTYTRWCDANNEGWTEWEQEGSNTEATTVQGEYYRIDITGQTLDLFDLDLTDTNPFSLPHRMEYIVTSVDGANNISGLPFEPQAFILDVEVIKRVSVFDIITKQTITGMDERDVSYTRYGTSNTWSEWKKNCHVLPTASTDILGGVKVDGTTITINDDGVISSASTASGGVGQNGVIGNTVTYDSTDYLVCAGGEIFNDVATNQVAGFYSHVEGGENMALGHYSHAEGRKCVATGDYAHAEGYSTKAECDYSHAEGYETTVYYFGAYAHAEGYQTTVSGEASHAEGYACSAHGDYAHAEGNSTTADGDYSHAEGYKTETDASYAHAEGSNTTATGQSSHAEGSYTQATTWSSHAEGGNTTAKGDYSHAEGRYTIAKGMYAHAGGCNTVATDFQYAIGRYNRETTGGTSDDDTGTAFVIGGGTYSTRKNAFRVDFNGTVYATSSTISTGADYAEYFEWLDGNVENEDRVGYFVTMNGDKIEKATSQSNYILGIVSATACIIGNGDEDWSHKYMIDEFGRTIYETREEEITRLTEVLNEETGERELKEITEIKQITAPKLNPLYDKTQQYIERGNRQEWDAVGMMGVLYVRDDGTCVVNGFCRPNDEGKATASDTGYRVIARTSENVVKIIFR